MDEKKALNEDALAQVSGGDGLNTLTEQRIADGVCPSCGNTRYLVTVFQLTENGPWRDRYHECVQCGRLD